MYTVFRFYLAKEDHAEKETLLRVGDLVNEIRPGFFEGLNRDGSQFSGTISESDEWEHHIEAMQEFLDAMAPLLHSDRSVTGQFDVAIDEEDRRRDDIITSYLVPRDLVGKMAELGVEIVFSMYWFADASPPGTQAPTLGDG